MATGKEIREALRKAKKAGCTVERRPNSHWRVSNGLGEDVTVPFSPGSSGSVAMALRAINKKIKEIEMHEREIKRIKDNAVRTGGILLKDKSMNPEGRRLFALRTIEAAAQQVGRLEKKG